MITRSAPYSGLNVTINTNEDCNLACKYCYEIQKRHKVIPIENAKKFIDIILEDPDPINVTGTENEWMLHTGIIIDFIGGDSLMHPEIVDEVLSYFVFRATTLGHRFATHWRASISTNGTLFRNDNVLEFLKKWKDNLSIGISIDGCPAIHDKNRIFAERGPNGEEIGSMATILRDLPVYKEYIQANGTETKATCSKDSIPYLFESLVFMHETIGLTHINQNFIMEPTGCTDEDYMMLDEQFRKCVDYCVEHRHELFWSMIDHVGLSKRSDSMISHERAINKGWCGSGSMPTIGITGKIYPCFRWLPHTLENYTDQSEDKAVGDVVHGLNNKQFFEEVRTNDRRKISSKHCLNCEYEHACAYCIGGCYSEFNEFKRTEHICTITKLRMKWSKIYWDRVDALENNQGKYLKPNYKYVNQ